MLFKRVRIETTAVVTPPLPVTSAEIEEKLQPVYKRLRLPEGRLELMTGIERRHFWEGRYLPSQASADAGRLVLGKAKIDKNEVDLLIHCGVCRDRLEPATAAYVHGLLEMSPHCQFLDISNACLGFLNAMVLAGSMIESGQIKRALLVSGENGKPLLEHTIDRLNDGQLNRNSIKPFFANLTIGAGAVGMLLTEESLAPEAPKLVGGSGRSDSKANQLCQGDASGMDSLVMQTEAEELLEAGIRLAKSTWKSFEMATGWNDEVINRYICHQVGKTHQRKLFEGLGLDTSKDFITYPYMGNVGSVSLPFTLDRAFESKEIRRGDKLALLGIGSGLSSLMLGVEV